MYILIITILMNYNSTSFSSINNLTQQQCIDVSNQYKEAMKDTGLKVYTTCVK